MEIYYSIVLFIMGTVFGSFYNVVGYRLPKGESLIKPSSHCPKCNHRLNVFDLFPIFSFVFLKGKCRYCKTKISPFYMLFEMFTGLLFLLSYLVFKDNVLVLITVLTFISFIMIICISDYLYLIIPDSVIIFFGSLLIIEKLFLPNIVSSLLNGVYAFVLMLLIKLFGDFVFKKESMGGADIKLMFVIGLMLGFSNAIGTIFLASIIGLPVALVILIKKKDHIIPFGPFLGIASIILLLTKFDISMLINYLG
jgi:leader peptidase (prepilin peptidase)/N-methyltransferase